MVNRNSNRCVECDTSPTVGRGLCTRCYGRDWSRRHAAEISAKNRKPVVSAPCLDCGGLLLRTSGRMGKQLCLPCYLRQWSAQNRARRNAQAVARWAADPEKYRAKERAYREAAPELHQKRWKRYKARHPERIKEIQRRFYYRNREREIADARQWQREHPERHAANEASRRAKISGQFVEHVIPLAVLEFADGVCGICGEDVDPGNFQIDHIEPLFHGGEHSYANTQPAHPRCNMSKGTRAA